MLNRLSVLLCSMLDQNMASDVDKTTISGQQRDRRWHGPRQNHSSSGMNTSNQYRGNTPSRLGPPRGRTVRGNGREISSPFPVNNPRQSVVNCGNRTRAFPRRPNARPLAMGGSDRRTILSNSSHMQPFRHPLPMNERFTPSQMSSPMNHNTTQYNHSMYNFHHYHNIFNEPIPANHVKFPINLGINQGNFPNSGMFPRQNHFHHRNMAPHADWRRSRPSLSSVPRARSTRIGGAARASPALRRNRDRNGSRDITNRGHARGRGHVRRDSAPPKRHLRWRNNYRDLQREIRNYFHPTAKDPLGLEDICRENERRDNLGLTPMRGDSAMNTPAYSLSTPAYSLSTPIHRDWDPPPPVSGVGVDAVDAKSPALPQRNESATPAPASAEDSAPAEQDSLEVPGSGSLDRLASDSSQPQEAAQPSQNEDRREVEEDDSSERHGVPANTNDNFHRRHRNRVFVNTNGTSRFVELTLYGNYHNYYSRRRISGLLEALRCYFETSRCLDVGCNSGVLTINMAKLSTASMLGIDIDGRLVQEARRVLFRERQAELVRRMKENNTTRENVNVDDYLKNVEFQTADYVPDSERQFEPQYDTITAFSVTKWIHLVHGDEGLRRFFRRVYAELREGGYFIVEPQPLRSYRRSYRAGHHYNPNGQLHLQPPFNAELSAIGFVQFAVHKNVRSDGSEFTDRPIYVFRKTSPEAVSSCQTVGYPRPPPCYYYPSPVYRQLHSTRPSTSFALPSTPVHPSPTGSYLYEAPGTSAPTPEAGSPLASRFSPDFVPRNGLFSPEEQGGSSSLRPRYSPSYSGSTDASDHFATSPEPFQVASPSGSHQLSDRPGTSCSAEQEGDEDEELEDDDMDMPCSPASADDSLSHHPSGAAGATTSRFPMNFVFRLAPTSRQSSSSEGTCSEASLGTASQPSAHRPLKMRLRRYNGTNNWAIDCRTDNDEGSSSGADLPSYDDSYSNEEEDHEEDMEDEEMGYNPNWNDYEDDGEESDHWELGQEDFDEGDEDIEMNEVEEV